MADLARHPIHLGLGSTSVPQPEFDGTMGWYEHYVERHGDDGTEGRLVAMHSFSEPWDMWEMHPNGSEVVVCTAGQVTLIQEIDGDEVRTTIGPGEYAINQPGTWHTADVADAATCLFITAGAGTEHRERTR